MLVPARLVMVALVVAVLAAEVGAESCAAKVRSRPFVLTCSATIARVPPDTKRLDIWVPIPSSDALQKIEDLRVETRASHEFQTEVEYGNRVLHAWTEPPSPFEVRVRFRCTRSEGRALADPKTQPEPQARLTRPDRLGIIDDDVRSLADQITAGKTTTADRAEAIYDYVIGHMTYDKQTPGWGRGDTRRACHVARGNCTDFHSLFISLARAEDIPCRFDIGFQVPTDKGEGPVEGYHCWTEFWSAREGWTPVDASEAWKHPDRREFYFGKLDEDRVRMSTGRDLRLPGMHGEPLNYFVFPYAEADGKPLENVKRTITFTRDR